MREQLSAYWQEHPLRSILILSFIVRLVSILFSRGYGMHDDHFLVIEAAQSWVDGFDYNNWLPQNSPGGEPTGHSFFYVGLHYILFNILDFIHLSDPQFKMFLVRLIHGSFSLLTVYYGFRISHKLWDLKNAKIIALLLGLYWFFPILSVRNMVEVVCIPFAMMAFWQLLERRSFARYIWAGVFIGLAIAVRIQMYLFLGGIGLVLLFRKEIFGAAVFGLVSIVTLFITQLTDLFLWGRPFAEIGQYVLYNSTHYDEYISQSWFQYLLVIGGLLLPPVSLFLFFGYFRNWKKNLLIFLPSLIFLLFHSFYPNKQERFILPFLPFFIMLGVAGWNDFKEKSNYWAKRPKTYRYCLNFAISLNIIALLFVSPASTKKSRIDTMTYMRTLNDVEGILLDRSEQYGCYLMPRFYMSDWSVKHICFSKDISNIVNMNSLKKWTANMDFNYILIIEEQNAEQRIKKFKEVYPELEYVEKIEPSYIDRLLHFLNPRNQNEVVYIYRIPEATS